MNRQMLLDHLEEAQRHISNGARLIEKERAILEERRRDGHDITQAEALLRAMEELQQMHIEHLGLISQQLARLD